MSSGSAVEAKMVRPNKKVARTNTPREPITQTEPASFSETVHSDGVSISGYLYKTAQCIGLMQSKYFLRRYYVLNKQTKQLTVHQKPNGKI